MPKNRTRPHTLTRSAAVRLAADAKRERDTRLAHREAQLTNALADFYAADSAAAGIRQDRDRRIAEIHADAQRRIDAVTADAHAAAEDTAQRVREAVAAMRALGEKPAAIAELCRLPLPEVRRLLAAQRGEPTNEANSSLVGGGFGQHGEAEAQPASVGGVASSRDGRLTDAGSGVDDGLAS